MRNALIKGMMLFLATCLVGLVGCSSNTQKENTGIGAVTGGVVGGLAGSLIGAGTGQVVAIGVGAITGALIGSSVGHSMDSSDTTYANTAMDNNPPNHPTHWQSKTGARYTIAPTSHRMTVNGNPNCRRYYGTVYDAGKKHKVSGVACRQANGTWTAVSR